MTKTKCTAPTSQGIPCKSWAMRDSDPPRCASHSGLTGAQTGNQNAVKHGYYSQDVDSAEIRALYDAAGDVDLDQEAILLRVYIHRLTKYLDDDDLTYDRFKSAGSLLISAIRALGYLKKQLPPRDSVDWDAVLGEVGKQLDWDL